MADDFKNYPSSSQDISNLLHLEADQDLSDTSQFSANTSPMPSNLPILEGQLVSSDQSGQDEENIVSDAAADLADFEDKSLDSKAKAVAEKELEAITEKPETRGALQAIRKIAPYVFIFGLGIFLYYFYFTDFSFLSIFKNDTTITSTEKQNTELDNLIKSNRTAFESWMKQFYFDVSDTSVLDPYADNSGNGLTNFQKYLLNLNPKAYDTLGLGSPDGQSVVSGIDPSTGKAFSDSKQKIIDKYFDLEAISNKLAAGAVAAANLPIDSQSQNSSVNSAVSSRGSSLVHTAQAATGANTLSIDTSKSGLIEIPSLKISVPLIWTSDTRNFDNDLKNGVVHYPGTALPGDIGTSYVSGHSSNYIWVKSQYNKIFVSIDQLKTNDSFTVTVTLQNGKHAKLHYVVKRQQIYQPSDQAQFANTADSVMALSTCWPPGTTSKRLVVFAQLTQVENLN